MKLGLFIVSSFLFFSAGAQDTVPSSIYDVKATAQNGSTIDLSQYKGKKILIINAPVEADNNPRYAEMEAFYQQYKDKVQVIAFLDDDYGPAPGSSRSHSTVPKHYNVSFPVAAKIYVKGPKMAPVYHWLTEMKYNKLKDTEVKWDFQKYLISEDGRLIAVFDPKVKATSPEVLAAIGN